MAGRTAIEGGNKEGDQSLKILNTFRELFKIFNRFKNPFKIFYIDISRRLLKAVISKNS